MSRWVADEITIECPFCKKVVVLDYEDVFEIEEDDELPDGYEVFDEEPSGDCTLCEHVALFCSWGYYDAEIKEQYSEPLRRVYNDIVESENRGNKRAVTQKVLADALASEILHSKDLEGLKIKFRNSIPEYHIEIDDVPVQTGDGPHGDGIARNIIIFLKTKTDIQHTR